jgi:hypothetical protein
MTHTLLVACAACGIAMAQVPGGASARNGIGSDAIPEVVLPPSGKPLPKMSNGKPDLSGMWIFRRNGGPASPREKPPYKAEFLAKIQQLAKDDTADPGVNCFMLGTPRSIAYPFPLKIVQSRKETIILYEAMRTFRDIPTDGRSHSRNPENTFMG